MKTWIIVGFVILILGIAYIGYLNVKQNIDLTGAQAQITALNSNYKSSQSTATALQSTVSTLQGSITALQGKVDTLQSNVTTLQKSQPQNTPSAAPAGSPITSNTMVNLIPQIEPFIARIDVTGSGFVASGSGIIIRNDGYVITNEHVIDAASTVKVTLKSGQQYTASVVSSDTNVDLAILKLNGNPPNLTSATLGTPADIIIGVSVIAAGFPVGLDLPGPASFSRGIVSAIRTVSSQKYVQTDATINAGSSGGGLFTLDAKLIGLTSSAILPRGQDVDGIGLAIPVDTIQTYIQKNLK